MSVGTCECPPPAALRTINSFSCGENLKQVQKIIFQRRQAADNPPFATLAAALVLANWQDYFDANDSTKMIITPFIDGFKIPPGEVILEGGDTNDTIDGIAIPVGEKSLRTEGNMRSLPGNVLSDLRALNCEGDVVGFLINQYGKIVGKYAEDGIGIEGIPVQALFIGTPGNEGLNTDDKTPISFGLRPDWTTDRKFVTPNFNARTDLNAAAS